MVKGALLTGCRYGELVALKAENFDQDKGTVYIADSKNGETRYVDLNDEGVSLFSEMTMRHYAHLCPTFKQESVRRNAPSFGFTTNKPGPVLVSRAS